MDEYLFCADLNGECKCQIVGARPCPTITALVEDEMTADDERDRMDKGREDAATEHEF